MTKPAKPKWRKSELALFAAPVLVLVVLVVALWRPSPVNVNSPRIVRQISGSTISVNMDISPGSKLDTMTILSDELKNYPNGRVFIVNQHIPPHPTSEHSELHKLEYDRRQGTLIYKVEVSSFSNGTVLENVQDQTIHAVARNNSNRSWLNQLIERGCKVRRRYKSTM